MTRYYLDTEFDDTGAAINLISIGLVCEDGRELYLVNSECNHGKCNDWVKANVLPQLPACTCPGGSMLGYLGHQPLCLWRSREAIRDAINAFIVDDGTQIEIWAYYASCDWVVFYQLFGEMVNLPKHFPKFVRDLKTHALDIGYTGKFKVLLPDEGHHDALCDARWNKKVHFLLNTHRGHIEMLDENKRAMTLADKLLDDLNDRSGFSMDADTREMIRRDWVQLITVTR